MLKLYLLLTLCLSNGNSSRNYPISSDHQLQFKIRMVLKENICEIVNKMYVCWILIYCDLGRTVLSVYN